jgi:hypothetical protein
LSGAEQISQSCRQSIVAPCGAGALDREELEIYSTLKDQLRCPRAGEGARAT